MIFISNNLEAHYGSLQTAIVRVPQLDSLVADLEEIVQKYKDKL